MNIYGVTGWKNAGKTTLVEGLVAEFVRRGLSVSTIKHAHHGFDLDMEGKDSWRHREAGAAEVLVASDSRFALMRETPEAPPTLAGLVARLAPVDLVLVEGYKRDRHPKIEVWREAGGRAPIAAGDPTIRAIASDDQPETDRPVLPPDPVVIADFIIRDLGLTA
ncbi:MAG: molybdopterin-guanine dinucleotide biosynthesis protein B [Pikeienuella sp.]